MHRREFLKTLAVATGATLLSPYMPRARARGNEEQNAAPELSVPGVEFRDLVKRGDRFTPNQVYPLENHFPGVASVDQYEGGNVSFVTEKELVEQFGNVVMRTDNQVFLSFDGKESIPYKIVKPVDIDPHIQGKVFHWGMDLDSSDPKKGTIISTIFRSKCLSWEDYGRLWPHAAVTQLVDKNGEDIVVELLGEKMYVIVNYGHIHIEDAFTPGQILEVGAPLGDITRIPMPDAPPHTHVEMLLIPIETINGGDVLKSVGSEEDHHPSVGDDAYLDWSFITKFFPGDMLANMGKTQAYLRVTKDEATRVGYSTKK